MSALATGWTKSIKSKWGCRFCEDDPLAVKYYWRPGQELPVVDSEDWIEVIW